LVERQIVILDVEGSNPSSHPKPSFQYWFQELAPADAKLVAMVPISNYFTSAGA
jgi:hypothetical protein